MDTLAVFVAGTAVATTIALFLWIAWKEERNVRSTADYLPLKRYLRAGQYRGTTVAAGMSLATVLIALFNLAPLLGISLIVTVITYCLGFVALYFLIPRILSLNPENLTIPQFLGLRYQSVVCERVAAMFTFLGYLSIFAMELLVGVTILEPFLNEQVLWFAIIYFIFLVTYTWLSGFRGIVATDVWQLRLIVLSLLSLGVHWIWTSADAGLAEAVATVDLRLFKEWQSSVAFAIGIAAINIPAAISDTATWQRLCSTQSATAAKNGLRGAIGAFAVLWTAIILLGILHSGVLELPAGQTLMEGVLNSMGESQSFVGLFLLFAFLLGLFSAMVSTADSLLLAGTHIFVTSVVHNEREVSESDVGPLSRVRGLMCIIALASFIVFAIFRVLGMNVVQLVFAIYGAQLALFPATLGALLLSDNRRAALKSHWIAMSVACGFGAAWSAAVIGHLTGTQNLLFYAPVVGLFLAGLIYAVPLLRSGASETGAR